MRLLRKLELDNRASNQYVDGVNIWIEDLGLTVCIHTSAKIGLEGGILGTSNCLLSK
jgi:hypothetical protein